MIGVPASGAWTGVRRLPNGAAANVAPSRLSQAFFLLPRRSPAALPALCSAALCLAAALLAASWPAAAAQEEEGDALWQSGEQYVRLAPREEAAVAPNEHPVRLAAEDLRDLLRSLLVRGQKRWFAISVKEPVPLFAPLMSSTLATALAEGLARAGPEQDVVFLLFGKYKAGGLFADRKAVAGRVFYRDERLHLILGDVLRSIRYGPERDVRGYETEVDRRIHPFRVGSRGRKGARGWELLPQEGISMHGGDGKPRPDWLEIELALAAAYARAQAPAADSEERQALGGDVEEARKEAAPSLELRRELRRQRLEMARMRKQMRELRDRDAANGAAVEAVAPSDLEERLHTLESLREQELVTEEEYQAKRRQLLDAL